jgi:hypothetical protein
MALTSANLFLLPVMKLRVVGLETVIVRGEAVLFATAAHRVLLLLFCLSGCTCVTIILEVAPPSALGLFVLWPPAPWPQITTGNAAVASN